MAIFKASGVVGSISGNVGGACFVNGRGSKVLRKSKQNRSSKGEGPAIARANMQRAQKAWGFLSDDIKRAWSTYAISTPRTNRLGEQYTISGYQEFVRRQLIYVGNDAPTDDLPPANDAPPLICPITFSSSTALGLRLVSGIGTTQGSVRLQYYGRNLYTTTIPKFFDRLKYIGGLKMDQSSAKSISAQWEAQFSLPIIDQVCVIRVLFTNVTGQSRGAVTLFAKTTEFP